MRKIRLSIAILLVFFCLISCNKQEMFKLTEVNRNYIIHNQITTIYEHDEVVEIVNQDVNMSTFCKKLNINYYKSFGTNYYTVLRTTSGLFMVCFDNEGAYIELRQVCFSPKENRDLIADLKIGMALDDVMNADPKGDYSFMYASWSGYPKISWHYFECGDCYAVSYEDYKVVSVFHFTL